MAARASAFGQQHGQVARHVARARNKASGRRKARQQLNPLRDRQAEPHAMHVGHARLPAIIMVGVAAHHLQRLEHLRLHQRLPRAARHGLQHRAEQHEVEFAVLKAFVNRPVEQDCVESARQFFNTGVAPLNKRDDTVGARKATGLIEQVAQRDARRGLGIGNAEPGQDALRRRIRVELAGVDGLPHQQRSERLGERADRERRVGADRFAAPVVAEASRMADLSPIHAGQCNARYA